MTVESWKTQQNANHILLKKMHFNLNGGIVAMSAVFLSVTLDLPMPFNKFIEIEDYLRAACINLKSSF